VGGVYERTWVVPRGEREAVGLEGLVGRLGCMTSMPDWENV
jgi:hypothetical protein